jgi:hypothetical protein
MCALLAPRFSLPVAAFHHANKIEELTAPERIVDDMPARPNPVRAGERHATLREPITWNDPAPSHAASKLGPSGAEHAAANAGMHAVGADQQRSARISPIGEPQHHAIVLLVDADAARTQDYGIGTDRQHGLPEYAMQVGAMDEHM